ncbi:pimeloyl-ACP methyl ester carboxylesterase [Litorivivens lipolytica]|uniref:Pimeloyl-ACP methyl ester carboxylesterase n=1 Tax=Litorivivens lipolytica TaxID=1524264 RepID=A0A7W4Z610_9GAMM|nr:alpha/beta hydrolase [Litorivivens lipolytica]MBB3047687.1 pimeloyl-ACP methyl ester carboxylesterase [Litorivivens lipolytica]
MPSYREVEVKVKGGALSVGIWGESGPAVLCSHGITSNRQSFKLVAEALAASCRVIVPDHRGRGRSAEITGPWGMLAHAEDMVAVLDALDIEAADLMIGHSMGGFITAATQANYPARVRQVILVDGGLPLFDEPPPGVTAEQLIEQIIGPSMQRLSMRFDSLETYREYWQQHPAFKREADWQAFCDYMPSDLIGEPGELRAPINKEAIIRDTESQLMSDVIPRSLENLSVAMNFLQAPRGILDDAPLYSDARLEELQARYSNMVWKTVDDVNHYTIVMGPQGAAAVVDHARQLLGLQ